MFPLFYADHYEIPLPAGHRFPMEKYRLVRQLLERSGLFQMMEAPLATREEIERAHEPEYVNNFLTGALPKEAMRRIGFPWSEGLVRRSLASAGGTLAATAQALKSGWGGSTSGGTHHAFYATGSGFCVFNDFAVAIRKLQHEKRICRAAVIDLDVHQGDGTAEIFQNDASVLTTSMHCKVNFPFRKQVSSIDMELEVDTGDEEYLRVLDQLLPEILVFEPEILFYQSGVDGLEADALGKLSLSLAGLQERDRRVIGTAAANGIPLVITAGGGYAQAVELTAQAHANTYLMAAEVFGDRTALAGD